MTTRRKNRRDGGALALSAVAHIVVIAILVSQAPPDYILPEPPAPPLDVQIVTLPPITPPPPIVPPKMTPRTVLTETPPPAPAPPEPKPLPAPPQPAKPAPAKPTPVKAAPVAVAPAPAAQPTPPQPQPPKPSPPKAAPPAPPTPAPAPIKLNIHKPEKDAPATVATLPMSPSPSQPKAGGAPAAAGGSPTGSRLNGLTPFPLGAMPSGGTGLRGTLVGCANADSVHLSAVERAHCNERFGVELSRAPTLDGINPSKRAAFDKAAAAQDRSIHSGPANPNVANRFARSTDFGGGGDLKPDAASVPP